jgi:hypothetical protein
MIAVPFAGDFFAGVFFTDAFFAGVFFAGAFFSAAFLDFTIFFAIGSLRVSLEPDQLRIAFRRHRYNALQESNTDQAD